MTARRPDRERLEQLTRRWRERHDARREERRHADRPPADAEREQRARRHFPYRSVSPAEYAARHGDEMVGYTYDDYRYAEAELDRWLVELGRILRRRREGR